MRRAFVLAILLLGLIWPATAGWQSRDSNYNVKIVSAGSGCSQSTTFLARTSLTGSDVTHYTDLICGMVLDGLITGNLSTTGCGSLFDVLYIFATHDQTTALLNLCGTNFGATNNSNTFTAYTGFTGAGGNIQTGFNPTAATSPDYAQDSAHTSIWNLTNAQNSSPDITTGANNYTLFPRFLDNNIYSRVNDATPSGGFSITDPRGHLFSNRSSSTARQLYQNASTTLNGGTVATYPSTASTSAPNAQFTLIDGSSNTAAMASLGGSLNSTQVTNFYNRLRTYMTAVGVP